MDAFLNVVLLSVQCSQIMSIQCTKQMNLPMLKTFTVLQQSTPKALYEIDLNKSLTMTRGDFLQTCKNLFLYIFESFEEEVEGGRNGYH